MGPAFRAHHKEAYNAVHRKNTVEKNTVKKNTVEKIYVLVKGMHAELKEMLTDEQRKVTRTKTKKREQNVKALKDLLSAARNESINTVMKDE